ncbi:GNAT family N-acetyltransferase [Streptomyces sp. NBC_01803]|uniref:GNAT family N-acetyltransferase n=1 Tax=Streptomyces sp. NBC_01803 TaxID=2975946 RepID=UPI002DD9D03E|nr:GNAT family N-acetyltransferase [Streptomyces sp. NBC_01803]WSA45697.1 GNAT family N-acetyltransferase [Streptomyces sp. NBC_01803]
MAGMAGMNGQDVRLRPLDEAGLPALLAAAVADADPLEVMPPVAGPAGWTERRRAAFLAFHRSRALAAEPVETVYAIVVGGRVAGAARLCPPPAAGPRAGDGPAGTLEAGLWIGHSRRGMGVGGAVLRDLVALARASGAACLYAETTPGNMAMRRVLASLGARTAEEDGEVRAWVELGRS